MNFSSLFLLANACSNFFVCFLFDPPKVEIVGYGVLRGAKKHPKKVVYMAPRKKIVITFKSTNLKQETLLYVKNSGINFFFARGEERRIHFVGAFCHLPVLSGKT